MKNTPLFFRQYGDTNFITGLRAIAATMVIIIHTGAFKDFGYLGQSITGAGKYGVDMFFVISGFTIAKTYNDAQNYKKYLTRRIFRIAPTYWIIISIVLLLWSSQILGAPSHLIQYGGDATFYNWFLHLSFLSYLDYRYANSILSVEWSIPIEVFWYATLPFFLRFCKSIPKVLILIFVTLFFTAVFSFISKKLIGTTLPIKWSPISYGHLFIIGAATYHYRSKLREPNKTKMNIAVLSAIVLFIGALLFQFSGRGELIGIATAIALVAMSPNRFPSLVNLLTSRPMLFLGSISYSLYLVHPLSIHFLKYMSLEFNHNFLNFLLVYCLTIFISSLTYLFIESPTNKLGHKLSKKI